MTSDRKAAIAAVQGAKDHCRDFRRPLRSHVSETWVGQSPNLEKIQNRIRFSLRQGNHTCHSLQAAWTTHGPDSLTFAECERLEEEEIAYVRDALLKERALHWRSQLGAMTI